ncbi:GroES-like protein [Basidiobolus meristosporus CBS 931.73]|uniref:GroES-like protein n=1 Tax=Basidiobolus meristosporus CBS 931.73 TaxID=1314790 RepID=A0A1Y1VSG4_9FUNG|nr:GroES-like protein [Basidiobolus meristosporus CBS 931.73]|eukprot:ORX63965.1 GroES-like protein [Basidiobolus meristosporus CBS 931.73]
MVEGKINEIRGWAAKKAGLEVEPWSYVPRPLGPNDVEIKIDYSGICGSDLHTLKDEWKNSIFPTPYPAIVGHEIVGRVITKGADVKDLEEGDIVGVGAQVNACLSKECHACNRELDPHCPEMVATYAGFYKDGQQSHGGYAEAIRVNSAYAFKLPESVDPKIAAPLMCAGTTVFAPMLRDGVKKGDRVGVVGIGGLGHLAIQYANALGAEVVAFSQSPNKRQQCLDLGASIFVDTSKKEEVDGIRHTLNYLFVTADCKSEQYNEFFSWMDFGGEICLLSVPPEKLAFQPIDFIASEIKLTGSLIGGVEVIKKALEFAGKHNIKPMVEHFPLSKVNEALQHMEQGKARYRIVLDVEY